MLLGIVSGGVIGLFFHRPDWLGGYHSFRRRLVRLGHIAFIGLGMFNLLFAMTLLLTTVAPGAAQVASIGFVVAVVTMPLCCFLTAWRQAFRWCFPIPVSAAVLGVIGILLGWAVS